MIYDQTLFRASDIRCVDDLPPLSTVVVGIDPPLVNDAFGMIACGLSYNGVVHVLADGSGAGESLGGFGGKVGAFAQNWAADSVIVDDRGPSKLATGFIGERITCRVRGVHRTRPVRDLVVPLMAAYEDGRIVHAGDFPALVDEILNAGKRGVSDSRLGALIAATHELFR